MQWEAGAGSDGEGAGEGGGAGTAEVLPAVCAVLRQAVQRGQDGQRHAGLPLLWHAPLVLCRQGPSLLYKY